MLTATGEWEPLKAGVHGLLLAVAAVCAVYNVSAWSWRRERHLAVNVGVYGGLVGFEVYQVWRHLQRSGKRKLSSYL